MKTNRQPIAPGAFAMTPLEAITDPDLTPVDKMILSYLLCFSWQIPTRRVPLTNGDIATPLGLSTRHVGDSLGRLGRKGYIKSHYHNDSMKSRTDIEVMDSPSIPYFLEVGTTVPTIGPEVRTTVPTYPLNPPKVGTTVPTPKAEVRTTVPTPVTNPPEVGTTVPTIDPEVRTTVPTGWNHSSNLGPRALEERGRDLELEIKDREKEQTNNTGEFVGSAPPVSDDPEDYQPIRMADVPREPRTVPSPDSLDGPGRDTLRRAATLAESLFLSSPGIQDYVSRWSGGYPPDWYAIALRVMSEKDKKTHTPSYLGGILGKWKAQGGVPEHTRKRFGDMDLPPEVKAERADDAKARHAANAARLKAIMDT